MAAGVVAAMPENEVGEQSDDSLELVGEHSPFIKHTGNRRKRLVLCKEKIGTLICTHFLYV